MLSSPLPHSPPIEEQGPGQTSQADRASQLRSEPVQVGGRGKHMNIY